jgi:putative PEP-CTERM system TPR-repeat lipoprotein
MLAMPRRARGGRTALFLLALLSSGAALGAVPAKAPLSPQVRTLVQRADQAEKAGDLKVAILLLKNAVQQAPDQAALKARLGTLLVIDGQMPEAERILREAKSAGAPDALTLPALFQAMLAQKKGQALLDQFAEPATGDRSQLAADTLRARALAYFSLNNADQADAEIDKALAIKRTAPILLNKAQFALSRGDRSLGAKLTDEALKDAPNDSSVLMTKMGLVENDGDFQGALSYANRLVQEAPNQPMPRILRVEALLALHRDAQAKADVDWLLQRSPELPIALYDRALLKSRAGDTKGAWQIAQALPPDFVHTLPQFGISVAAIAAASGNREIAEADLTSVISNFPKSEEARIRMAAMRLADKSPKDAVAALEPIKASADPRVPQLLAAAYKASGQTQAAAALIAAHNPASDPAVAQSIELIRSGKTDQGVEKLLALSQKDPSRPDVAGTLIGALIQAGRDREALDAANRFASAAPKNPLAPLYRGEALMTSGDLDGAVGAFTLSLKTNPDSPAALYYRSQALAARGDLAAANADLDAILRKNPSDAQALAKKAQYAMAAGQNAAAAAYLQRAAASSKNNDAPQLALAQFYLAQGQYDKAEGLAGSLAKGAQREAALAILARSQIGRRAFAAATATARQLAGAAPKSATAQLVLGQALEASGDAKGAEGAYQRAAALEPANLTASRALALHYLAAGESGKAVAAARAFARNHPDAVAAMALADTLVKAKQPAEAQKVLAASLAQKADSRVLLALVRVQQMSDRAGAENRLAKWLSAHGDDSAALVEYAALLMNDGNLAAARPALEKAAKLEPYNVSVLNDLAWVLQKSDPRRALQLASLAARIAPQSGAVLDTLGWIKWQQNDRSGALDLLRKAHALSPSEPEIGYHLAVALDGNGKRDEARQTLQPILKSDISFKSQGDARKLADGWR